LNHAHCQDDEENLKTAQSEQLYKTEGNNVSA
jgi:hypothetical protein